jgi:Ca2+-binding RTX toxin-like protein
VLGIAFGVRRGATTVVIVGAWFMLGAVPAGAVVTCDHFDPGSNPRIHVDYSSRGDSAVIRRVGDAIHVNGSQCDGATVTNTDYVEFRDNTEGNVSATISLAGGLFEPGSPTQLGGEIVLFPNLDYSGSASARDRLIIVGGAGGDVIRYGVYVEGGEQHYINLDADESVAGADVADGRGTPLEPTVEIFRFAGGGGADRVSGLGGAGTGEVFDDALNLAGQAGSDALTGGDGSDTLIGGDGRDALRGARAGDALKGSAGNDLLVGGPGADRLVGGPGRDRCQGGPGADVLVGCEA